MDPTPLAKNPAESRWKTTFRALKHRNFQLFFSGQLVSLIGTWMQVIAESWLVYRLTGSAVLLGSIGFASQIPVFLFAPLGGMAADRVSRHRLVIATQASAMTLAMIYATLILTNRITIHEIFVLAALLGGVNAFDIPARQAFMVEMVGREDLMNAIALNSSMFNGARIVGPAVAGVLIARIGEGWCFFANGVSYAAVIAGLLMMRIPKRAERRPLGSPTAHIIEGFRFVRKNTPIRDILLLLGVISLVAMPYAVLMPIFADRILHGGARGLGLLMGATGIGALLGALTVAAKSGLRGLGKFVGIAAAGFGVSLVAFSQSRNFWLSFAFLIPVGYGMMLETTSSNTLIQAMVPDELRGRVLAVYTMMFMGMAPLGSLFAGIIAHHLGAPLTLAIGGTAAVVAGSIFLTRLAEFRTGARQLLIAQGLAGGNPAQEIIPDGAVTPPFSGED
ncbi:MAG TPA: MFS transporter [Terriglobales bacterium]|nr:MFS transporter [Terriglobales bacterium]